MSERVVIWVPFRTSPERARIFDFVLPTLRALGYPVIIRDSGDDPFSIARTWNLCAQASGDWDKAIRWGADFLIIGPDEVHNAVSAAGPNRPYVKAFTQATKLTLPETRAVLDGGRIPNRSDSLPFGGPSVITREAFEAVGGYDPRFVGWGHEDRVFVHCLETLCGPRTSVPGRMVMLRHPGRLHLPGDPYYSRQEVNHAMWMEYAAITDPEELNAHIAKTRA